MENGSSLVRLASCAVLLIATGSAAAQTAAPPWKPDRNVEIVIPGGVGGGQDRTARIMQKIMQAGLVPTSVTVINRPGGGGNIAYTYLNQFIGDAHYLATATATLLTNNILGVSPLNYTHFTPVSVLYGEYIGFATKADGPFKTGKDLIARMKSAPDSVSFAFGTSRGNANHIGIALAMKAAGIDPARIKVVIYKASIEATSALMGGHVDVVATPMSTYLPVLETGKIRIVAIAAPKRVSGKFADVPTWKEQGYDAVMPSYRMFIAARGLDARQLRYWDGVFAKLAKSEAWRKELAANEWQGSYMNSAESLKYLEARYAEYRKILMELKLAK
ncbi:MAG: tripartite tricarboxylate transporter substrate binding protein [Betaproteobacteria bacterium]|nr:tripartite tricarboxylate transporter substrate binding protein [Betaproteobacteria bacterium]